MAATIKQLEHRSRQAEKERDLADEANRFFKQEFGDKIESLQLEVEQLTKKKACLEQELKKERQRKSGPNDAVPMEVKPSLLERDVNRQMDDMRKELEVVRKENVHLRTVLEEKESLSSSMSLSQNEEEQDQSVTEDNQPSVCNMCEEEESLIRPKKLCNNCREVFCESCLANELPLPSSISPVQVCNQCHSKLLHQYSSSPS
ncbi:RUN and FYVE domain-containing protein 1-like [Scleropages formosus]|nr:RUN and FYVE domain-containing protein 1-like [Scleropages formosus]